MPINTKSNTKKIVIASVILVAALLFSCLMFFASNASSNQYQSFDIATVKSTYRATEDYTAPTLDGYLFAGWYTSNTDADTNKPYTASELDAMTSGTVYAKFVPAEVLAVKMQSSTYLSDNVYSAEDEAGMIRFLTSVDSLNYQKVGFNITINGVTVEKASKKVYTDIKASDAMGTDTKTYVASEVFGCDKSTYFKIFSFEDLETSTYRKDIKVEPFWQTIDGTIVKSTDRTETVNQARHWDYVYVDGTNGNDANAGTMGSPFKTINAAIAEIEACVTKQNTNSLYSGSQAAQWIVYTSGTVEVAENITIDAGQDVAFEAYGSAATIKRASAYTGLLFTPNGNITFDATNTVSGIASGSNVLTVDGASVTGAETYVAYVTGDGVVTVNANAKFSNHITNASSVAGVFKVHKGTLNITGGTFENNQGADGGVVYASGQETSVVNVTGGTFNNNTATGRGGGVFCMNVNSVLNVSNATFTGNSATKSGGVINANYDKGGTQVTVTDCTFTSNSAGTGGRVITVASAAPTTKFALTLDGCKFTSNSGAAHDVYVENVEPLTLAGTQTTGVKICLNGANDKVTTASDFAVSDSNKVTLTAPAVKKTPGSIFVTCASSSQATTLKNSFTLAGEALSQQTLTASDSNLLINMTYAAAYNGTKYTTIQAAVNAISAAGATSGTVTVYGETVTSAISIPTGLNVTFTDDGTQSAIVRGSSFTTEMFVLGGAGTTVTFDSTSASDGDCSFIIDGGSAGAASSYLVHIQEGMVVNAKAGVNFRNHKTAADTYPGVFRIHKGTLNISGGVYEYNEAYDGGVAYTSGQVLSVINVTGGTFRHNKATDTGGGVFCLNAKGTLNASNATFDNNEATKSGGAINANFKNGATNINLTNCAFTNNSAGSGGRVLTAAYDSPAAKYNVTMNGCTFEGNSGSANDVFLNCANFTLGGTQTTPFQISLNAAEDKVTLASDFAANTGVVISLTAASTKETAGSIFVGCTGTAQATSVKSSFALGGTMAKKYTLKQSGSDLIIEVPAAEYNGVAYDTIQAAVDAVKAAGKTSGTVIVYGEILTQTVTIPDNTAITLIDDGTESTILRDPSFTGAMFTMTDEGGASLTFDSTGTDDACKLIVDGNTVEVPQTSVAIVHTSTSVTVKDGVKFCNHLADPDTDWIGGVFHVWEGTLNIQGGVFDTNRARTGGVAYATGAWGSIINVTGGTFTNNRATYGGVFCTGAHSTLDISNATFDGNWVSTGGGVIMGGTGVGAKVYVADSIFKNNYSEIRGGGAISMGDVSKTAGIETALETDKYRLSISGCTFENNRTNTKGTGDADAGANDVYVWKHVDMFGLAGALTTPIDITLGGTTDKISVGSNFAISGDGAISLKCAGDREYKDFLFACSSSSQATSILNNLTLTGTVEGIYDLVRWKNNLVLLYVGEEEYTWEYDGTDMSSIVSDAPVATTVPAMANGQEFRLKAEENVDATSYRVQQGACTDGTYAYFLHEGRSNTTDTYTSKCKLYKVRMSDWTVVGKSAVLNVDHGNSITYNADTGKLIIAHCTTNVYKISYVNPSTLAVTSTSNISSGYIPNGAHSVYYNATRNQYVVGHKNTDQFVIYNSSWNYVNKIQARDFDGVDNVSYQSISCDDNYIYMMYIAEDTGDYQYVNVVCRYTWDGTFSGALRVDYGMEIQTIFNVGDAYYAVFYPHDAWRGGIVRRINLW